MSNNFKESMKSNYPEKIHQLSKENEILIQKLSQIPQNKELLYGDEIDKIWKLEREILTIGLECKEILKNSEVTNDMYKNEQLSELSEERKAIERCVSLICDRLYTVYDREGIDGELIMRNMGGYRKYKNEPS